MYSEGEALTAAIIREDQTFQQLQKGCPDQLDFNFNNSVESLYPGRARQIDEMYAQQNPGAQNLKTFEDPRAARNANMQVQYRGLSDVQLGPDLQSTEGYNPNFQEA
jgi:hypothetical protein